MRNTLRMGGGRFFQWRPSQCVARRAEKRESAYLGMDPTVFMSVPLVIMVFFMLGGQPFAHGSGVDIPHTQHAAPERVASRDDAMRISVSRDGKIFFRSYAVDPT